MARLVHYVVAFAAALTLNFALPRLMPGSPLALLAGSDVTTLSAADRDHLLARAGLDQPLPAQFGRYLADLARGDLGYSYQRRAAVADVLAERVPWTLLLMATSQTIVVVAGIVLGALAAWHRGRTLDAAIVTGVVLCDALPAFWIGMVLLAVLAVQWSWFPLFGAVSPWTAASGAAWMRDVLHHLVLPTATLAIAGLAGPVLVARAALAGVLDQPYLHAARARGVGMVRLVAAHALPNALVPIVTAGTMGVGLAVGGAPLVETVFSYPGVGRLVYEAVLGRDYPVLQGAFLLVTSVVLAVNALSELLQSRLDPRVRGQERT